MAYSKSKRAIYRVKEQLDFIYNSDQKVVMFSVPEPSRFAYLIRQAIHSASYNDIPPYNHMAVQVIEGVDSVQVIKMNYSFAIPTIATFNDVKNLSQLMLTITSNPKVKEFKFPNASLNELEHELFLIWRDANNLIGDYNSLTRKEDGKEGQC